MECLPCCTEYPRIGNRIEIAPDEHYDVNGCAPPFRGLFSHENILRIKFLALAFIFIWIYSPWQIAYRVHDLFTGGFYYRGYENALHSHRSDLSMRGKAISSCDITCYVVLELIKDVGRIALLPLYLVALVFSSIIGWFCPEIGRRLFSRVDELYFVQPIDPYAPATLLEYNGNLAAPCMKTRQFRDEMNLFRYRAVEDPESYHPETTHTLHLRLKHLMNKKAAFYFSKEELAPIRAAKETINPTGGCNVWEARSLHMNGGTCAHTTAQRGRFLNAIAYLKDAMEELSNPPDQSQCKKLLSLAATSLTPSRPAHSTARDIMFGSRL